MKLSVTPQGFTLIEFVVIISIFAIMAGVALVNFAGFRTNVGLNNLSHDIALTIRQAQVFGWATQSDITGGSIQLENDSSGNPVRYADGVYFKYDNGAFAKEFILYTKGNSQPGGEYYQDVPGTLDVIKDTIKIQGPNHISEIRYADKKSELMLDPVTSEIPPGLGATESFSVAFSRPHPEALFFSNSIPLNTVDSNFIGIYISADDDKVGVARHVITISRFGEIAVQ